MKKLSWIFAVIASFFVGDRIAGWVLQQLTERSQFRYSRLYQMQAEADILLVGNSRGLIFYQPYIEEQTGKSTFNISYNGMPMDLARVLIEDYLDKYPAPKQMILDVTMCDRENKALTTGYNMFVPYSPRMYDMLYYNDKNSAIASKISHLYRYNSEIFQRSVFYLNKSDEDWLIDREINQSMVDGVNDFEMDTINLIDSVFLHLNIAVKAAVQKGVDVKLVINPYYPAYAARMENLKDLKIRAEQATGLPVRDYSTAVKETKGFGDYQHLNKYGSKLFIDKMIKDGILK